MSWSDYKVERQTTPQPRGQGNLTLEDFGWAPGHYTIPCASCPDEERLNFERLGAKRSWRCKEHAQEAMDRHMLNPTIEDDAK